jgi:hypothetical protein
MLELPLHKILLIMCLFFLIIKVQLILKSISVDDQKLYASAITGLTDITFGIKDKMLFALIFSKPLEG